MNFQFSFFAFFCSLLLWTGARSETGCPPPEDVRPCSCIPRTAHDTYLECSGITDDSVLKNVFQHSKGYSFREVHLSFTTLQYLPQEMFDSAVVSELYIQNSTLNALFDSPPKGLHHLYKLHLENTRVIEISQWELLTPLTELRFLNIYFNLVETIDSRFEEHVPKNLAQLTMYATGTKEIKKGAFVAFTNLNKIAIDGCKLKELSRDLFPRPFNVKVLYFQDNELTFIPEDLFTDMPNLQTVGLKSNFLQTLPEAAFDGKVASIDFVLLDGNPLRCDCSLLWLVKNKPHYLGGTCTTPIRLHDKKLQDLAESDFKC